jgi:anti-sigma B factor antagonist
MAVIELSAEPVSHPCLVVIPGGDADRGVVELRGEHDISTVTALSETLARAIARDDADLIVDLSGVLFMDAATIGVIVWACNILRLRSRSLVLRSPSALARRVLEVCGLAVLVDPQPVIDLNPEEELPVGACPPVAA